MFPRFKTRFIRHLGPIVPPLPIRFQSFKEIRYLFLLWIIKDNQKGISGSEIQEMYNIPRGTLLRILEDLENNGYIISKQKTTKGKSLKLYYITKKGEDYLDKLREKWAERFTFMADATNFTIINPPIRQKIPLHTYLFEINKFNSKEDALKFLEELKEFSENIMYRLKDRIENTKFLINQIDLLIENIKNMSEYNKEKLRQILINVKRRYEDFKIKYEDIKSQNNRQKSQYCSNCGCLVDFDAFYCPECGTKLEK